MAESDQNDSPPECPHCRGGAETYLYMKKQFILDVDVARQIVRDGREPEEVDEDSLRICLDATHIYPEHVQHVDIRYPGIIAHLFYPLPDGTVAHGHALIDGNHRAVRCLELGRPFLAHILTEDESRAILLKSPRQNSAANSPAASDAREAAAPTAISSAVHDASPLSV